MSVRKLTIEEKEILHEVYQESNPLLDIVDDILMAGGKAYLVGGSVRDCILGCQIKDLDIEVHALSLDQLSDVLQRYGPINYIGKSFGVLRLG
ncbi:MAG TPA: hypothetical protein VHA52_05920, partial [Candidatus Babeliaceae bacterium]|nr:hypothetical protein [Candidatus Babeliaceae bacterium]